MAEQSVTIQGQHKQANTAGTNDRKELRESLAAFVKVFLIGLIVLAAIVGGYALVDGARDVRARQARIEPVAPATQPAPTQSGVIQAQPHEWSSWLHALANQCLSWQGEDPTGHRFDVQYADGRGEVYLYTGAPFQEARAVRFKSRTGHPEKIIYTLTNKTAGRCS